MIVFALFQCNQLGNNLKDVVDKYKKYDDTSASLMNWLNGSEEEARKQQSEAIAADPQTLQKQLEETKARKTAVVTKPRLSFEPHIYFRLWVFLFCSTFFFFFFCEDCHNLEADMRAI